MSLARDGYSTSSGGFRPPLSRNHARVRVRACVRVSWDLSIWISFFLSFDPCLCLAVDSVRPAAARSPSVWNHFQYSGPPQSEFIRAGRRRIRRLRAGTTSCGPQVYDNRSAPSHRLGRIHPCVRSCSAAGTDRDRSCSAAGTDRQRSDWRT